MGIITNFASKNASIMHQCMSIGKIQELTICGSLQTHSIPPQFCFQQGGNLTRVRYIKAGGGSPLVKVGSGGPPPRLNSDAANFRPSAKRRAKTYPGTLAVEHRCTQFLVDCDAKLRALFRADKRVICQHLHSKCCENGCRKKNTMGSVSNLKNQPHKELFSTAPTPGENQQYSITGKILLRTLTLTFITILILAVSASVGAGILCLPSIFWTSNRVSLFFVNLKAITLKTF